MKNYYLILGVARTASLEEIKEAYRQQAKTLHPDYYGQDSDPFLDLQEAYAVLSDAERRKRYDRQVDRPSSRSDSATSRRRSGSGPSVPTPVDLGELSLARSFATYRPSFDELFDRLWRNFDPGRPEFEPLERLSVEVVVSPEEARRGGRVRLGIPIRRRCPTCRGRGGVGLYRCRQCLGHGALDEEYPVTVAFPPGIVHRHVTTVALDRLGIENFYLNVIFRVS